MLEPLRVPPGDALARRVQLLEPRELGDPDRAEKIGQPVVEARRRDVEVAARHDAVVAEPANRVGELGLVGRHGPPLAGGDDLARVEREAAHQPERPARRVAVARAERAGGILDEDDLLGHGRLQLLPLDRAAEEVHGEHGLRPRRHRSGDAGDVDVERVRIDVDEDGAGAAQLDDVRRRRERVGGNDHLVARADPERQHRQVQGCRARRRRRPRRRCRKPPRAPARTRSTFGPIVSIPVETTSANAAISASPTSGVARRMRSVTTSLTIRPAGARGTSRSCARARRRAPLPPRTRAARAPCPCSGSGARRRRSRAA